MQKNFNCLPLGSFQYNTYVTVSIIYTYNICIIEASKNALAESLGIFESQP